MIGRYRLPTSSRASPLPARLPAYAVSTHVSYTIGGNGGRHSCICGALPIHHFVASLVRLLFLFFHLQLWLRVVAASRALPPSGKQQISSMKRTRHAFQSASLATLGHCLCPPQVSDQKWRERPPALYLSPLLTFPVQLRSRRPAS